VLATLAIVVPVEAQLGELAADGLSVLLEESPAKGIMVFDQRAGKGRLTLNQAKLLSDRLMRLTAVP
jgi:hypothetical protein